MISAVTLMVLMLLAVPGTRYLIIRLDKRRETRRQEDELAGRIEKAFGIRSSRLWR
jgi:hypothetical protein